MSKIFMAGDHHFGHEKILEYCSRPYKNTKEMAADIIIRHNTVVTPSDTIWFLGDVFWGDNWQQLAALLKRMNGTKHLIVGNHDHMNIFNYIEAGFTSAHTSMILDDYLLIHDPAIAGCIKTQKTIHGHLHGLGLRLAENTWNVSVEMCDYTPVDFEYIKLNWNVN